MNVLIAVATMLVAFYLFNRVRGGSRVSSSIVKEKIQAGASIIDVRTPDEFRDGAYPKAVNVPLNEIERRLAEIPKHKPVVLYCASGARSGMAARTLKRLGFLDVINAGGLADMPAHGG